MGPRAQLALAHVLGQRRGALELGPCLGAAAELGQEVAADARQERSHLETLVAVSRWRGDTGPGVTGRYPVLAPNPALRNLRIGSGLLSPSN